jgi:hypothetical protein
MSGNRPKAEPKFRVGDRVTLPYYNHGVGRIVELRGPLGPGGALIYDVRFGKKPYRRYIEVREDQLVPAPAEGDARNTRGGDGPGRLTPPPAGPATPPG